MSRVPGIIYWVVFQEASATVKIMAEPLNTPVELDFFLTERAMNAARDVGVVALDCDAEELQGLLDFVEDESGKTLPVPLADTSFVIMRGDFNPRQSEPHYYESPLDLRLWPAGQLAVATLEETAAITKQEIVEGGKHVHEVRPSPNHFHGSIGHDIARVVLGPAPEDARMAAPISAWLGQIKDAFVLPDTKKQRIQDEVARRSPNAVRLRRATDPRPAV
jgi:hypothetical protein